MQICICGITWQVKCRWTSIAMHVCWKLVLESPVAFFWSAAMLFLCFKLYRMHLQRRLDQSQTQVAQLKDRLKEVSDLSCFLEGDCGVVLSAMLLKNILLLKLSTKGFLNKGWINNNVYQRNWKCKCQFSYSLDSIQTNNNNYNNLDLNYMCYGMRNSNNVACTP